MNSTNAKDYLPLVQALAEGKVIQQIDRATCAWADCEGEVKFFYSPDSYRIKPEPREIWVNEYPDGVIQAYASKDHAGPVAGITKRYREIME